MFIFERLTLYFIFGILMLVLCVNNIKVRAENVILRKNNMINMADQEFDNHKLTKRRDLDPQTCVDNFDIHRDKIIRTEDSREMGAKYLNEIDLGSRDECLRLCCETESCDVFVFEEKSPGSCYLFHCGPPEDFKCKFTRHTNFSSAVLAVNRHLAELEDQIKLTKHEQDLASLRKQAQENQVTSKPVTVHPVMVAIETSPPPTNRRCSRFQFECHSSEECIGIYNACDGIPQCADGSDEAPELGCPATTTLPPPPNLPPREILPQIPQIQHISPMQSYGGSENIPKESQTQHQQAFMRPMSSVEGPPWPRHLDSSMTNNPIPHVKQYNDNIGGSHIFNHKGGLQVTETDSIASGQYDYKGLPYDSLQENNWQHRQWPQPMPEPINVNEGAPMYHMDIDSQSAWKQQQPLLQNMAMQHRMQNGNGQMSPSRIQQNDKMPMQSMPNMFQDRDKMWAVPQMPNIQPDNQPLYTQQKVMMPSENKFDKTKTEQTDEQQLSHSEEKNKKELPEANDEEENDSDENSDEESNDKTEDTPQKSKHGEKTNKKHNSNKTKKKHLKPEHEPKDDKKDEKEKEHGEKRKDTAVHEQIIMGKQFEEDIHDGAAERPPGAILLLTLGVCMTSIMIVLLGCRLKMARRRMRRSGKSPFAHDADYLVNGMYL